MELPRLRISVRCLMLLVAIAAVLVVGERQRSVRNANTVPGAHPATTALIFSSVASPGSLVPLHLGYVEQPRK